MIGFCPFEVSSGSFLRNQRPNILVFSMRMYRNSFSETSEMKDGVIMKIWSQRRKVKTKYRDFLLIFPLSHLKRSSFWSRMLFTSLLLASCSHGYINSMDSEICCTFSNCRRRKDVELLRWKTSKIWSFDETFRFWSASSGPSSC